MDFLKKKKKKNMFLKNVTFDWPSSNLHRVIRSFSVKIAWKIFLLAFSRWFFKNIFTILTQIWVLESKKNSGTCCSPKLIFFCIKIVKWYQYFTFWYCPCAVIFWNYDKYITLKNGIYLKNIQCKPNFFFPRQTWLEFRFPVRQIVIFWRTVIWAGASC